MTHHHAFMFEDSDGTGEIAVIRAICSCGAWFDLVVGAQFACSGGLNGYPPCPAVSTVRRHFEREAAGASG